MHSDSLSKVFNEKMNGVEAAKYNDYYFMK